MIRPRSKPRRGQPSSSEKREARQRCCERAGERCEQCGRGLPLELGQLHHEHAKRRFGWMESEKQRHIWLCAKCHFDTHSPKACPPKGTPQT